MGAMKEHPRYNVVSIRISDAEREALQHICKEANKSVSTILREIMVKACIKEDHTGCCFCSSSSIMVQQGQM